MPNGGLKRRMVEVEDLASLAGPMSFSVGQPQWLGPGKIAMFTKQAHNPRLLAHELAHELQWQSGLGLTNTGAYEPKEWGQPGRYARYGRVAPDIVEGAADVIGGTQGYWKNLTPEQRSQANAIAEMLLAASRERR